MLTDTDVKQEIFKRLDIAAEKLGVAADHLWHVLIRQGIAQGIADLVVAIALGIVMVIAFKLARKWWAAGMADQRDGGVFIGTSIAGYCFFVVMFFSSLYWLYCAVLELANPEYFALRAILEAIGGK